MKKYFLLTPGPTPIPPEVAQKESLPILHHRTSEFGEIFNEVIEGLKYVFQTKEDCFLLSSSGTGAMESAVANLISPQDDVLVASCGNFGDRWEKICKIYKANVTKIDAEWGTAVNPQEIKDKLEKNRNIKAVFTTHTETSTGVVNDLKTIGEIVSKTSAVLVIDAISGLAGQPLFKDEWKLDVVVSGSQKGLMCAPGLSFIAINQKAWNLVEKSTSPRFYFDYKLMKKSIPKKETPFTPAVSLIVALAEAIRIIKKEELENIFKNIEKLAKATRAGVKALNLELFAKEEVACNVLTSAKLPENIEGDKLVGDLRKEFGISIAGGQDKLKGKIFRIAHMGFIDQFDVIVGLSGIETMLKRAGHNITPGKAVSAFKEVL
ncbi:MAG: class V aminotransferase [Elusimicrobia bacterium CG1_02_37_114]|nr:MAG: class V aminotransferase [Elusimicrobia bacterium CG1_02_37_114]